MSEEKQASYRPFFKGLEELGTGTFVLRGSTLIVEIVPEEELKSKGGIIISTPSDHRRQSTEDNKLKIGRVVMSGLGYENEAGEREPCEIQPGAMIIIPKYSAQPVSVFPGISEPTNDKLVLVKEDQVLAYYPTEDAYATAKQLSSSL